MTDRPDSYLSPLLEARYVPTKGGRGVFALEAIPKGTLLMVWGGQVLPSAVFDALAKDTQRHSVQIEEDLYLLPRVVGPADYINHCCDPNAGLNGQVVVVAMQDITAGEEVCYDYAMTDGSPYDEFACKCGAAACRGRVTGEDWRRPELIDRYAGYFSAYLQRRINEL